MTRAEFVRAYAKRSGLSDEWAEAGIIDVGPRHPGRKRFALPCGCESEDCVGWAMVSADSVLDHLFFNAPTELTAAYRKAVIDAGGE